MKKSIQFQVQGSASEPYKTTISINNYNITCLCDCKAGINGSHCKHWMGVFEGTKQDYINIGDEQLREIQSWLPGSDLEEAWNELLKIKDIEKSLKIRKSQVIKKFRSAMRN